MTEKAHDSPLADLTFYKAVLDALEAHIALLDGRGTILAVNAAWRHFGEANGIRDPRFGVGANYFAVCRAAVDPSARAAAAGIQDVLSGRRSSFHFEYPCHSPDEERWFTLRATPLTDYTGFGVVAHENITERVITERTLTQHRQIDKLNLVAQRFQGWHDRIEELLTEHQGFREICEDYQELAIWIEDHQSSHAGRKELEDSLQLLDSLVEEIGYYLSANNVSKSGSR